MSTVERALGGPEIEVVAKARRRRFTLEPEAVDRLRAAARTIPRQSPAFQALRQKLNSPPNSA